MLRKKIAIALIGLLSAVSANAQYDVHFSNYELVEAYYNPATVGKETNLNVVGAYAMQMMGFENAPRTMYVGADIALPILGGKHGVGAQILNDQIGFFTNQSFSLQYAFHTPMFGGQLSAGVNVGFISEGFDGSKVEFVDGERDDAFPAGSVKGSALDLGAGIHYSYRDFYAGVGAKHLTQPKVLLGETNELQIDASYFFMAVGNIRLKNPLLSVQPSVMLLTDATAFRADLMAKLCYQNDGRKLVGGLGYSPGNSVTALVGGTFHGIELGYAFEWYTSALGAKSGSHELTVSYKTDLNLFKKGKNKHKSIRYL